MVNSLRYGIRVLLFWFCCLTSFEKEYTLELVLLILPDKDFFI